VQEGELEIVIETTDETLIEEVESSLSSVQVERWEPQRLVDPITVLAVAGSLVQLLNGLAALRDRLRKQAVPPAVTVRNADGAEVALLTATPEQLQALFAGGDDAATS
jgi:hypothetical protein